MLIEDFIEQCNTITDKTVLFSSYQGMLENFSLNKIVYTFVTDHLDVGKKAVHGIMTNYPVDWMEHYIEKNYEGDDPVRGLVLKTNESFLWENIPRLFPLSSNQKKILSESEKANLYGGVGIPLHGARGEIAGMGLASDQKVSIQLTQNELSRIRLITQQFHYSYLQLEKNQSTFSVPHLTPREKEILQWWSLGKTADEVALIIGCSKPNIKWHVKQIYTKLETNSKTLATLKAIAYGLIELDKVRL